MAKVRQNQLLAGKRWHGLTTENHLTSVYMDNPVQMLDRIEHLYDVNLGMDFVSFMNQFDTYEVDRRRYSWPLLGATDSNFELLGAWLDEAGTTAITAAATNVGQGRMNFYMDFAEKAFNVTEVIVGHRPDDYKILITEEPKPIANGWRYTVQLITSSHNDYIPGSELLPNTRWSSEYGLVTQTLSDRGFDIGFSSHAMLNAETSMFRMQHTVPGNMINKGKVYPMPFYFLDETGKQIKSWITNVEWEFLKKARQTRARLIMYGKSNRWEDGSYGNYDKNGYEIAAGSGLKEQWSPSNKHTFAIEPDIDEITEIALAASVGKTSMANRKYVMTCGEWGYLAFARAVENRQGAKLTRAPWMGDTTGRAYKWSGNDLHINFGQVKSVATVNGIEISVMIDPYKDDEVRNKLYHPSGGVVSSYEYDIMDMGGDDNGKGNMQIVNVKGEEPIFGVVNGMRSAYDTGGSSITDPKKMASPIDGYTMHHMQNVGAITWNPTKVTRYYPEY